MSRLTSVLTVGMMTVGIYPLYRLTSVLTVGMLTVGIYPLSRLTSVMTVFPLSRLTRSARPVDSAP